MRRFTKLPKLINAADEIVHNASTIDPEHCFIIVDNDGYTQAFIGRDEASYVLYLVGGYRYDEVDSDEAWSEFCEDSLDRFIPRDKVKVSDYVAERTAYKLADLLVGS